ncbi:MAG: tetratricopeptide repeat protein [Chloroflexi bacterium]|nr:tetratricopeptide repeat protein [Chloroflexota bacterium]
MYANSQSNKWLDRSIWVLGILVAVVVLGFGAYYVRDRYFQPNVSMAQRDTKQLEDLVKQDPQNIDTRLSLAQTYLSDKMYDQAITQLQEVLKVQANHPSATLGLGITYARKGDDANALKYLGQFIDMTKSSQYASVDDRLNAAYYEVGRIYMKQANLDKAIENFKSALAIDPTDSDALYQIGTAFMQKGQYADAAECFRQAATYVPDFVEAYQSMAVAYDKNNEPAKGDFARAMVGFSSGSYQETVPKLEKVIQSVPNFVDAHYALAMTYEHLGQKDKAIAEYQKVLTLDPNKTMAKNKLQQLTGVQQQ